MKLTRARQNTLLALALGAFAIALAVATLAYNIVHKPYANTQQETPDVAF